MKTKATITKTDVIVASSCVLFLLIILGGSGSCGRRRARERAICLNNLRQLTLAWIMYADENDDKIVNGMAGKDREEGGVISEKAWTGKDWADGYEAGAQLPEDEQIKEIKEGSLWPYCKNIKLYSCPVGLPGQIRTYSIVDSMNGIPRSGTHHDNKVGVRVGRTVLWIKKRTEIISPGPAYRLVFVDVGRATPDSFAVHYDKEQWLARPPVRHAKGTHVSFVNGPSEYWEWKARETVKLGKSTDRSSSNINIVPQSYKGKEDLHRLQKAVWGKLGYTPSD